MKQLVMGSSNFLFEVKLVGSFERVTIFTKCFEIKLVR